jgi:hypothetical protein
MRVRVPHLILVGGVIASLVLGLLVYAGLLTGWWVSLLACTPALLAVVGIVGGMICGMFFFEAEEDETPEEAARLGGAALLDRSVARLVDVVRRAAVQLHLRGSSH